MALKKYVPDTSVIVEGLVSKLIKEKKISGEIVIHEAVIAELEHQTNTGRVTGTLGFGEIKELRELAKNKKMYLSFDGKRPSMEQIRYAKIGEIDAMIRELAGKLNAVLITSDFTQKNSAESYGIKVLFFEKKEKERLKIERYFDAKTMSVHLKEKTTPKAKKGMPGDWEFVELKKEKMTVQDVESIAKEIIEEARINPEGFVEVERRGSTIVQYKNYRIVITKPPFSDGWEITAVKPIVKLRLKDYDLPREVLERFEIAEGVLISGPPGHGKSTLAQALAEFYLKKNKIVKTIEAPRDLHLPNEITQYSKNLGTSDEIHDILLLSRPDYTIFDEMRNTHDFRLYSDMRLSGVGMIGIIHATTPIDAIQRFVGRVELGMIPSIIDTVIFIKNGFVKEIYELKITVKVPSGMMERDLARPVIEVRDFLSKEPEYEMYTFGEQTVVVPVKRKKIKPKGIPGELKFIGRKAVLTVSRNEYKNLRKGKKLRRLEKRIGKPVEVRIK